MKLLIQTSLFLLLTTQICFGQWFWQNPLPQGNTLYAIEFISENNIVAVGDFGTIIISTNGGMDWEIKNSGSDLLLIDVSFANLQKGWVVGENGIILKTTDGGDSWNNQNSTVSVNLSGVCFINENTGIITGGKFLLRTSDGGENWTELQSAISQNLNSVCFVNDSIGYITSSADTILKTTDSGITWSAYYSRMGFSSVNFSDLNNGVGVGSGGVCWTTDGGENWILKPYSPTHLFDVSMINETTATTVGLWQYIHKTTNAGTTWYEQGNPGEYLDGISYIDSDKGVVVGNDGRIYGTTDGGLNWVSRTGEIKNYLSDVFFVDENNGWIAAENKILHTTDGGNNWNIQEPDSIVVINSVCFTDLNNGSAVGIRHNGSFIGTIIHTSDGGQNWINQFNISASLYGIFYTDSNNGIVVGNDGTVLKTTDNGIHWLSQISGTHEWLQSVYFINSDTGWIGGDGIILHTTDGGNYWSLQLDGFSSLIYDINFTDPLNGFAVGGIDGGWFSGGIILHTSDGGLNWVSQTPPDYKLVFGVSFIDKRTGYICIGDNMSGEDDLRSWYTSSIQKTTDAGETWIPQITVSSNLLSICFPNADIGYTVGTGGAILKTTNGGVSFVEENPINETPTEFLLSQNYPNPFNPNTKIKYSVPQLSQVQIKVFDVLGNEIETLVKEEKPAGTYELNWNAANLPSGVYFYQIKAVDPSASSGQGFVETKKMLLLK